MDSLSYVSDEYLLAQAGIDTEKFKLGKLCKRGHDWEGTSKTLRRVCNSACIECRGVEQIKTIPVDIPEEIRLQLLNNAGIDSSKYKLRSLCKYNHNWNGTGLSLRTNDTYSKCSGNTVMGKCVECVKLTYQPPGGSDQYNDLLYSHGIDPTVAALGQICKKGHDWNNTGLSLRRKQADGLDRCLTCESNSTSRQGFKIGEYLKTLERRFFDMVEVGEPDECWPWKGHLSKKGYGRFNLGRHGTRLGLENDSVILAHRLAFLLANGELDPDLMVLHSCDFPACCNSKHLRQGTAAENSHDMASRDRSTHGERNPMVKFKEHEIIEMRVLRWVKGWTCQQIMDKFDSNVSTVSTITRGLAWERSPGPTCFEDVEDWLRQSV
jgi:hypothetical protein